MGLIKRVVRERMTSLTLDEEVVEKSRILLPGRGERREGEV